VRPTRSRGAFVRTTVRSRQGLLDPGGDDHVQGRQPHQGPHPPPGVAALRDRRRGPALLARERHGPHAASAAGGGPLRHGDVHRLTKPTPASRLPTTLPARALPAATGCRGRARPPAAPPNAAYNPPPSTPCAAPNASTPGSAPWAAAATGPTPPTTPPAAPSGNTRGWQVARWLQHNARTLRVKYVIYDDKVWRAYRPTAGWTPYTHPNGATSNPTLRHLDHVHLSTYT